MDNSITAKKSVQKHDGQGALAGIRPSRLWTLGLLWTVRVLWTLGYSGWSGGVQSLDACVALDGSEVSRVNASLKVKISSSPGGPTNSERYTRGSNQSSRIVWRSGA